jgi:hypothetical protein
MEIGAVLDITKTILGPGGIPLVAYQFPLEISMLYSKEVPTFDPFQIDHHVLPLARYTHKLSRAIP